jgi:peptidoglycan/LPS O-acetylase OafA/YrhL
MHSVGFGGEQELDKNNFYSILSNLLLIHSIGVHDYLTWNFPSWSISVEFFTYIVFFIFIKSVDKGTGLITPAVIFILCYSFLLSLGRNNIDVTYDFGLVRCIAGFYLGVFLFRIRPLLSHLKYNVNIAEITVFTCLIASVSIAHNGMLYQFLSIAIFFISLFVFSNSGNGFLGKVLHSVALRAIGVWSYSIYMLHAIVLSFTDSVFKYIFKINSDNINGITSLLVNATIILVVVLLSRFTYIYIEDRYRKIIKSKINSYT